MNKAISLRYGMVLSILTLAGALGFVDQRVFCAPQSGAALTVQVQPEAYAEVGSLSETAAGGVQSVTIPLQVMIRLNRGSIGTLSISPASEFSLSTSRIEVETAEGTRQIAASPLGLRSYSRSGRYQEQITLKRARQAGEESQPLQLLLKLTSSDGGTAWSRVVTLPSAIPSSR